MRSIEFYAREPPPPESRYRISHSASWSASRNTHRSPRSCDDHAREPAERRALRSSAPSAAAVIATEQ
jgi:hypothetical protein